MWILLAFLSAFFAGITAILAKAGIKKTDSDVAMAFRSIVILIFAIVMVIVVGSFPTIKDIDFKSLMFLILSGMATGASWMCYFKALSIGDINKVVPIDKSSVILTVLFAMFILGETDNIVIRLISIFFIGVGTYFMIEKKTNENDTFKKTYVIYAGLSAIFAALTSILSKIGISNVEANLGTAIRTVVVLLMAWLIVFMKGKSSKIFNTDKKELGFIVLSGIATGASWLCYYKAIKDGVVSIVVPIDKLSIVITVLLSYIFFKERLAKKSMIGLGLIVIGTFLMVIVG